MSASSVSRARPEPQHDDDGTLLVPMVTGLDGKVRPGIRYDTSGRDALIRQLRAEGTSMRAVAAEVFCSAGTVHRVLSGGSRR